MIEELKPLLMAKKHGKFRVGFSLNDNFYFCREEHSIKEYSNTDADFSRIYRFFNPDSTSDLEQLYTYSLLNQTAKADWYNEISLMISTKYAFGSLLNEYNNCDMTIYEWGLEKLCDFNSKLRRKMFRSTGPLDCLEGFLESRMNIPFNCDYAGSERKIYGKIIEYNGNKFPKKKDFAI